MVNLVEKFNNAKKQKIAENAKKFIEFNVGDTISVGYRITEGANTRLQNFEGTVLAKSKDAKNFNATFVVRKISAGIGVERKFQFHSPLVEEIKVVKSGIVNKAKLYYLRDLTGKSARIKEDLTKLGKKSVAITE
ncbi:MAG: 50S ribosomal protein L19 [Rickettsiales bacterium]|jgi:large subunit ribosomal protein L19|nr:50S ribosomal protein L19 [Rickettsiales bacterium]